MDKITDRLTFDAWEDDIDITPFEIDGARIVPTCWACPEQYDVSLEDIQIGYLRLRWGHFRADYPDCGGQTVYEADFDEPFKGSFTPEERVVHLPLAVAALKKRHKEQG